MPRQVRWGLFSRDNYRRGRGAFSDQGPSSRNGSGFSAPAQPNGFGSGQPAGFGGSLMQAQPQGFGGNPSGLGIGQSGFNQQNQSNGAQQFGGAGFGQPAQTGFAADAPGQGFAQSQPPAGFGGNPSIAQQGQLGGFGGGFQATPPGFGGIPAQNTNISGNNDQNMLSPVSSGFGQPSQPAFGTTSNGTGFGAQQNITGFQNGISNFGSPQPAPNALGTTNPQQPTAFGQPMPQPNGLSNGFPSAQPQTQGFFNGVSPQAPTNLPQSNGTQPANGFNNNFTPELSSYATFDVRNNLRSWKGQPVVYDQGEPHVRRPDGSFERIWFPNGAPGPDLNVANGIGATSGQDAEAWAYLRQHGVFQNGVMPQNPPGRSDLRWDL